MIVLDNVLITYKKSPHKWALSDFVFIFYVDGYHLKRELNLLRLLLFFTVLPVAFLPYYCKRTIPSNRLYLFQGARILVD
jgi:hypothetical protein